MFENKEKDELETILENQKQEPAIEQVVEEEPKRRRGRPRKKSYSRPKYS